MRRAPILVAIVLSGCGGDPATTAPAAPVAPVAPAVTDIPRSEGRVVATESDMRILEPFTGDLDALIERGAVRVLVAPGSPHFNVDGHLQRGRTVDAAIAFERFVNQRIAPRTVAVQLMATSEGALGSAGSRLVSLEDAGGRAIHVRRDSDHHASLVRLNDQLKKIERPPAKIVFVPAHESNEELLDRVNTGGIPATLVDDYVYEARRSQLPNTAVNREVAVSQDGEIAWVTRKDAPRLLALVSEFFTTHRLTF